MDIAQVFSNEDLANMGIRSVLSGGRLFCGVTAEQFAINGVSYKWQNGSHLKWSLDFTSLAQLTDRDLKDCFTAALKEISGCCDITHEYVANTRLANILITRHRLDGPSGVLADCQIPPLDASPDDVQLIMRLDDGEHWVVSETPGNAEIDLYRTCLHELEHGHGLGHKPANIQGTALISPMYSLQVRNLQDLDKSELVRRYGGPSVAAPPAPPPAAAPGSKMVDVSVSQDGKVWSGSIPRIK